MQYLVTGGTGFIGRRLVGQLLNAGHQVTVVSRQHARDVRQLLSSRVKPVGSVTAVNPSVYYDAIINLAGEGIMDKRWSASRKRELLDSRIGVTLELCDLIERMEQKPGRMISGSAVGYYGTDHGAQKLDETAPAGNDFAASLCNRWEQATDRIRAMGVAVTIVRTGIVLHPDGGALQKMLPPFRLGLGGPIGHGDQMMSWIHMDDMVALLLFLLDDSRTHSGVFNAVAPNPVDNRTFARALGKAVKRPACISTPAAALKLLLGESATLLIEGQAAIPANLQKAGFTFKYPELGGALSSLLP